MDEPLRLVRDLVVRRTAVEALDETTPRALPRIGDEEDLEIGVGKYDGADVASVDHHVVLARGEPHLLIHPIAYAGHARHARNETRDVGSPKLELRVLPVDQWSE